MSARHSSLRARHLLVPCALLLAAPVAAEFHVDKELALAPGGRLEVDADAGRITVTGRQGSGARVRVASSRGDFEERFDLRFEEGDGTAIRVVLKRRGRPFSGWFGHGDSVEFEIEVPVETELDLDTAGGAIDVTSIRGDVELSTSGGALRLRDVEGKRIEGHTSGGEVDAERLSGDARLTTSGGAISVRDVRGDLAVDTSGGSIDVAGVSGAVDAETSGGPISLEAIGGAVKAHSSGGPVTARLLAGNADGGSLSSSGGRVTVYVDPQAALDIDASSSGGGVTIDLPVTVRGRMSKTAIRGELNGGGALLRLRSSGGGVRVRSN